ncbi:MAG: hypothetical protein PVJ67_03670 [Candidatus Pacearchaeota archaeon]|jgi:hypothetical protein
MPQRDMRSNVASDLGFYAAISTNTTTTGQIIDTADYDSGVMFSFAALAYTDGTYTPLITESDNSGMAGATQVPDTNLIGTEAAAALSAATTVGSSMTTLGIGNTKRYVQISIVSTGVTTGATITATTSKMPELKPAA